MKLTCEAVEDLYVIYQEGELHPNVKQAVDEHLETCQNCKTVYETGDDFMRTKDVKSADQPLNPSEKLDQQIKLKLKLRRMRIAVLFLVAVMVMFSFFQYIDKRKNLLYEVSSLEQTVRDFYFELDRVKWEGDPSFNTIGLIDEINEKTPRIMRQLNFYERRQQGSHPYQTTLNFSTSDFLQLLHERYKHGKWSAQDEEAFKAVNNYVEEYQELLEDARLTLNHVYDYQITALVKPFPIQKLKDIHYSIDTLAYTYSHYQVLPEDIEILSVEERKARAREVFQLPHAEVRVTPDLPTEALEGFGSYNTMIEGEHGSIYAEWNAYTGRLLSFNNNKLSQDGELLPEDTVQEKLQAYVPRLLSTEAFRFESKGINYNYNSNVDHQLYTYRIIPTHNGFDTDAVYRLTIDARTGELASLITLDRPYYPSLAFATSEMELSKEQAVQQLENDYPGFRFSYKDTLYVPSILSNQYELVYTFNGESAEGRQIDVLVNVSSGEEEVTY